MKAWAFHRQHNGTSCAFSFVRDLGAETDESLPSTHAGAKGPASTPAIVAVVSADV